MGLETRVFPVGVALLATENIADGTVVARDGRMDRAETIVFAEEKALGLP